MTSSSSTLWLYCFFLIPLIIVCWCLKHYYEEEESFSSNRNVPEQHSAILPSHQYRHPINENLTPPSCSRRTSRIGYRQDINETSSLNRFPIDQPVFGNNVNSVPYPIEDDIMPQPVVGNNDNSVPYPIEDLMPQPLRTSTHSVSIYPLPSDALAPVLPSSDEPPSYSEAMRNK